jgi:polysaccharide pyruvyl transferase WcaK-like protein
MTRTFFIFNDKFSANVGDGLLSECLEYALSERCPADSFITLDIDGKMEFEGYHDTEYSEYTLRKSLKQKIMALPMPYKDKLFDALRFQKIKAEITQHINNITSTPSAFIIGGGHLITATSSYFPLRILALGQIAEAHNIPLYIQSVGVSFASTWEDSATTILRKALRNNHLLKYVSVRDETSRRNWQDNVTHSIKPHLCRDPGILSYECYKGHVSKLMKKRKSDVHIGLGIINQSILNKVSENAVDISVPFYISLIKELHTKGYKVTLFTNGDLLDDEMQYKVEVELRELYKELLGAVSFAKRPMTPLELCGIVAQLSGVIAHRMHANILSYSLQIPHVGLGWDSKLKSFFHFVERDAFFITPDKSTPSHIADTLHEAIKIGFDKAIHKRVTAEAWQGIDKLVEQLAVA